MFCCTSRGSSMRSAGSSRRKMSREHIELFEVYIRERQHLRKEGIEAHVIGQLAAEIMLFVGRNTLESFDDRRERSIKLVLRRFWVEIDSGKAIHVGFGINRECSELRLQSRTAGLDRSPPRAGSSRNRARTRL